MATSAKKLHNIGDFLPKIPIIKAHILLQALSNMTDDLCLPIIFIY